MTLLEAVFAVGVLAIGFVGVAGLLSNVSATNRSSAFLNASLDVFATISAQIQNAPCDHRPGGNNRDPGLTVGPWITAPVANSEITHVGLLDAARTGATAPIRVAYNVVLIAPGNCPNPCTQGDTYRVDVQLCDQSDPGRMACATPQVGYWVRTFQVSKTCTVRLDDTGRGEFY